MQEEIQCPKCWRGTLEPMNDNELKKAGFYLRAQKTKEVFLGCDECQYYEVDDE